MNTNTVYQFDLFTDYCLTANTPNIIDEALQLLSKGMRENPIVLNDVSGVRAYCRLKLAALEYESFSVLFLDSQHRLIEFKALFRGTIDSCAVYVREVVKEALALNAAAVIFTHNHPSGICEPSHSDITITRRLKEALAVFDINVLDHIIVSVSEAYSLAEHRRM
jgi:DNA repair protein RadC